MQFHDFVAGTFTIMGLKKLFTIPMFGVKEVILGGSKSLQL